MIVNLETVNSVEVKGYQNTWSSIDSMSYQGKIYHLLENEEWGDETCYLLVDNKLNVIGETFDDIETAISDYLE